MSFSNHNTPAHILVAREDAMGDVVLAMPVCGLIKKYYPSCKITFLGRTYTKSLALSCIHVDEFMNYNDWETKSSREITALLKESKIDAVIHLLPAVHVIKECRKAGIRIRIGASNKLIYLLYCNRLVPLRKKKSGLSEAQLNIKLLRPLNIKELPQRDQIYRYYGFDPFKNSGFKKSKLLDDQKFNLIIHPLSNKRAKEWGLHNFSALIKLLNPLRFRIFITGSAEEKKVLSSWIELHKHQVTDLTGAFDIDQLISFIAASDGLLASSTGPVHIAAAAGINTLGLYENSLTKGGQRWGPIGKKATYLQSADGNMDNITPEMVQEQIIKWTIPIIAD